MAITSIGYDGSVDEASWAKLAVHGAGRHYGVVGPSDWRPTIHTVDRTVRILAGTGYGHGVLDIADTTYDVQCDPVASGSRWDLIVARRNWGTNTTSFIKINGSATKQLPSRSTNPGGVDDQPIALVRVTAGQQYIQEVEDLRVWQSQGGAVANSDFVLQYLGSPGADIQVGDKRFTLMVSPSTGAPYWKTVDNTAGVFDIFGAGQPLAGPAFPGGAGTGTSVRLQAGTRVGGSDPTGFADVIFPVPFPNGLLSIVATGGDAGANQGVYFVGAGSAGPPPSGWGVGSKEKWVYQVYSSVGGSQPAIRGNFWHRLNWIAIGW